MPVFDSCLEVVCLEVGPHADGIQGGEGCRNFRLEITVDMFKGVKNVANISRGRCAKNLVGIVEDDLLKELKVGDHLLLKNGRRGFLTLVTKIEGQYVTVKFW